MVQAQNKMAPLSGWQHLYQSNSLRPEGAFSVCTAAGAFFAPGGSHCLFATTLHFWTAGPKLAGLRQAAGSRSSVGQPFFLNSASHGLWQGEEAAQAKIYA